MLSDFQTYSQSFHQAHWLSQHYNPLQPPQQQVPQGEQPQGYGRQQQMDECLAHQQQVGDNYASQVDEDYGHASQMDEDDYPLEQVLASLQQDDDKGMNKKANAQFLSFLSKLLG